MMFQGNAEYTLDAKNRLFIPVKIREQVGDSFILFLPPREKCLYIYSEARWEEVAREVLAKNDRGYERLIFGNAVTIAGTGERLEIWDTATRNEELARLAESADTYSDIRF